MPINNSMCVSAMVRSFKFIWQNNYRTLVKRIYDINFLLIKFPCIFKLLIVYYYYQKFLAYLVDCMVFFFGPILKWLIFIWIMRWCKVVFILKYIFIYFLRWFVGWKVFLYSSLFTHYILLFEKTLTFFSFENAHT